MCLLMYLMYSTSVNVLKFVWFFYLDIAIYLDGFLLYFHSLYLYFVFWYFSDWKNLFASSVFKKRSEDANSAQSVSLAMIQFLA